MVRISVRYKFNGFILYIDCFFFYNGWDFYSWDFLTEPFPNYSRRQSLCCPLPRLPESRQWQRRGLRLETTNRPLPPSRSASGRETWWTGLCPVVVWGGSLDHGQYLHLLHTLSWQDLKEKFLAAIIFMTILGDTDLITSNPVQCLSTCTVPSPASQFGLLREYWGVCSRLW